MRYLDLGALRLSRIGQLEENAAAADLELGEDEVVRLTAAARALVGHG